MEIELSGGAEPKNWYSSGIEKAHACGLITYLEVPTWRDQSAADSFSHIVAVNPDIVRLKFTNSRTLPRDAENLIQEVATPSGFDFLELGPGAGVAVARVRGILPEANINSVSHTPINPFLTFRQEWFEDLNSNVANRHHDCSDVFCETAKPIIDKQYVGDICGYLETASAKFDFIYDSYGPLSAYIMRLYDGADEQISVAMFHAVAARLNEDGVIYMNIPYFLRERLENIGSRAGCATSFVSKLSGDGIQTCAAIIRNRGSGGI